MVCYTTKILWRAEDILKYLKKQRNNSATHSEIVHRFRGVSNPFLKSVMRIMAKNEELRIIEEKSLSGRTRTIYQAL